ncbi:MAG: cartilage oligomeric matrix protein [Deltaproteobacteria bacterium]|nr:cartilage oligomeric matrix protein [Deltaproteobacteria bacterium]
MLACSFSPPAASGDALPAEADTGVTIDGPSDRDHDGMPDEADNCPDTPNPDQRNHDGDPKGDACDFCPHLASATDPDADGDGIGDACDPRNGIDTRLLWVGFYDEADIAGWSVGGTWTFDGMTARQADASTTTFLYPPLTYTKAAVQAGVVIDLVLSAGGHGLGVGTGLTGSLTNPDQGYLCFLISDNNGVLFRESRDVIRTQSSTDWPVMISGSTVKLDLDVDGTVSCHGVSSAADETVTGLLGATTGRVGLFSQSAEVRFDYLFVVGLGS